MQTDYNRMQKRQRLFRDISHFEQQVARFEDQANSQRKRCYTIAVRCLKSRREDLTKLDLRA